MPSPPDICILKLGGSLITDKARECAFRQDYALQLAREVATFAAPLVLVHGTGSFGKPPAQRFGYSAFLSRQRAQVVSQVEGVLDELRSQVLQALRRAGVRAYYLSAAAIFWTSRGGVATCAVQPVRKLLERGLCPIISGAIVSDEECDFAVLSSDLMAASLATALPAQRLVFATDVPGLMAFRGGGGELVQFVQEGDQHLDEWLERVPEDISGGMGGKLQAGFMAARAGVEVSIVDGRVPGRVLGALSGRPVVATRLVARPVPRAADKQGAGEGAG